MGFLFLIFSSEKFGRVFMKLSRVLKRRISLKEIKQLCVEISPYSGRFRSFCMNISHNYATLVAEAARLAYTDTTCYSIFLRA